MIIVPGSPPMIAPVTRAAAPTIIIARAWPRLARVAAAFGWRARALSLVWTAERSPVIGAPVWPRLAWTGAAAGAELAGSVEMVRAVSRVTPALGALFAVWAAKRPAAGTVSRRAASVARRADGRRAERM